MMATILSIIPYHFYPPQSGGALRCFYLLREMSKEHLVYVLTVQSERDFYVDGHNVLSDNVKVVSLEGQREYTSLFNIFPQAVSDAFNYRWIRRSIVEPANKLLLKAYPILVQLLSTVSFDIVYYESLEALALFNDVIKSRSKRAKHLYDAHNVDSELWRQKYLHKQEKQFLKYSAWALRVEQSLHRKVDAYFCCSEVDNEKLQRLNNYKLPGFVVPNGVDVITKPFNESFSKTYLNNILFCGSLDYYPNKEGLIWFYRYVFPIIKEKVPNLKLTVIGSISEYKDYQQLISDISVIFKGRVDDVSPYYRESSVAIVPLLSGSGTRLKILEAMSLGNPIVSTNIGAEGISCISEKHLLIADHHAAFGDAVISLISNNTLYNQIRSNAYTLVKAKYSWDVIGKALNQNIKYLFK